MSEEESLVWAWFGSVNRGGDTDLSAVDLFTQICDVVTLCLALGADNDDKDDIVENAEDVTHRENVIETHEHIPNIDIFSVHMR